MKYMTPELLARFRSSDDDTSERAAEEWERRGNEYRTYLDKVEADLPAAARTLLNDYALHDAKVLTMAVDERSCFSIVLELETPRDAGERHLQLDYQLVGHGLRITAHKGLEGDGKPLAWWAYDEMELVDKSVPIGKHSVLLSGGYELEITFSSLECTRLSFFTAPDIASEQPELAVERLSQRCA